MNNGKRSLQSENPDDNRNTKKRRKNVTTLEDVRHGYMSLNPNSTPLGEITNSGHSQSKDARTHRLEIRRMKKSCGTVVKRPDVTATSTMRPISTGMDSQSSIILNPQSQAEGRSLGNNDATPQPTTLGSTGFQSQTSQNHNPHSHVKDKTMYPPKKMAKRDFPKSHFPGSSVGKKCDVPSQSYANPISTALYSQTSQILNPHSQVKEHISYPPKKMAKSTDTAQVDSDESDSGSELWDCTSSDDDDNKSDSDTFEDDHAKRIERQARINMVANRFAQVFGCLTNKDSPVVDVPVVSRAKEEEDYKDDGDLTRQCLKCGALFWYNERVSKSRNARTPVFTMCCMRGKVQLPQLKEPPELLRRLLTNDDSMSKHFRDNIRPINMMFSFTSLGGKIDNSINKGQGPKVFKLHGENYHLIGSLKPPPDHPAKFSQLYIHDTENEVQNRIAALRFNAEDECQELSLVLIHNRLKDGRVYNLPTSSEVAALVVGDFQIDMDKRDIILEKYSGKLKRINELHPCYLPLQYPLIFPYGEDGFRLGIQNGFTGNGKRKKPNISMREFFAYRIQIRNSGSQVLLLSRRLLQQFLVDAYTMIETHRLRYIRKNQANLRTLKFSKFVAAANDGNTTLPIEGNRIIIPSSFTGGPRYMHQMYLDAMTICKYFGFPDLFITFTCNPKWPELSRYFQKYNLRSEDRPELCCRLFKVKLDCLMEDLTKKHLLGKTVSALYTIEFQKRGLPHAHILLFMDSKDKFPNADDIDRIISAEIPEKTQEPKLYEVVKDMMIHGPCGVVNKKSPCMQDGKCSKFFPRKHVEKTTVDAQGYPVYRRREDGAFVEKKGIQLDNRFVVPYNKSLLLRYNAHINVEWCNQTRSIKYLFKYINKGTDRITATVTQKSSTTEATGAETRETNNPRGEGETTTDEGAEAVVDEIKNYFEARYISACESSWRILAFPTHYRSTPVENLTFHLEGEQPVIYKERDSVESVLARVQNSKTMFLAWFVCCERYPEARDLTYAELPTRFVYDGKQKEWNPRKKGFAIGRLAPVSPSSGQKYFLRVLLNKVRGPRCYDDIKTVEGIVHPSYEDACYKLGLLDDDKEYIEGLKECSFWASSGYVRKLFANMLLSGCLSTPKLVWEATTDILSEDILYIERKKRHNPGLIMTEEEILNCTLVMIENILQSKNSSLANWESMPKPIHTSQVFDDNQLLQQELNYDRDELQIKHDEWLRMLTDEQKSVYDEIIGAVLGKKGGVFFVYGFGGTGKTFLWNILSAAIRSRGDVVLNVASSGIASLLLPGGRTAHSRFGIPLNPDEFSTCNIEPGSHRSELISRASLIIWDEAPMMSKHCFEALDRTMCDIMNTTDDKPFGGKTVVFGGDFRQILPVIPRGNRADIRQMFMKPRRLRLFQNGFWTWEMERSMSQTMGKL
ncbi:uncharacterized protein LOC106404100 [Brassica napus]|uniref:uncharacterized protein LOC106404100 n=1 Tax=Brassica napus TaxID=3708 RepID=UPI0020790211|nr:uncharacterized protein LOC106404100 [Brassica napus]